MFAPGVISTAASEIAPAFVDGGKTVLFSRHEAARWAVLRSEFTGHSWSLPTVTSFSGQWNDLEAAAAPDGRYVIFASDRPAPGENTRLTAHYYGQDQVGGALWRVDESGAVRRLPASINANASVWTPSIAANDNLAFMRTDSRSGRFRIFLAKSDGKGDYRSVVPLAFSTGAANDVDPTLDPAERFLIFSSDRDTPGYRDAAGPEHLFIAFRPLSVAPLICPIHLAGWSDPKESEVEPRLNGNETRLYFASRHADHPPGGAPSGAWDNGQANIWVVRFSPALW
jgi:Tol biopolymer transport system component